MKSYSFADLFAGCGGLSLGLSQAGLKGKFAIERDPMAFETFSANFIDRPKPSVAFDWPIWLEKQAWDIEHLLAQHKEDLVSLRGTIDVLAGGPPCQGFAQGKRQPARFVCMPGCTALSNGFGADQSSNDPQTLHQ